MWPEVATIRPGKGYSVVFDKQKKKREREREVATKKIILPPIYDSEVYLASRGVRLFCSFTANIPDYSREKRKEQRREFACYRTRVD